MPEFKVARSGESESEFRQFLAYLFSGPGVVSGLSVAQTATASNSVTVSVGMANVVQSTLVGAEPLINNSTKTLDVLTANPLGGVPRNDVVVFDAATSTIRAIVGTPNAVPTDPTVPASAVALARLRHAASATTIPSSAIDDLRTFTRLFRPDGAPWATASGSGPVGVAIAAGALSGPYPQVFPAGRFSVPPNITLGTSDSRCNLQATSISTSGFNLWIRNNSASSAPAGQVVYWTATQMAPTSANG